MSRSIKTHTVIQNVTESVQQAELFVRDSSDNPLVEARFYLFNVDKSKNSFPTSQLSEAGVGDLWLIQEHLDEYLDNAYSNETPVIWLDYFEKKNDTLSDATSVLKQALDAVGNMFKLDKSQPFKAEVLMHPYPIGVSDDYEGERIQQKLMVAYAAKLGATKVTDHLMRIFVQ